MSSAAPTSHPAGRPYQLRVKVYDELVRHLYPIKKFRLYFPRTLLLNNQVGPSSGYAQLSSRCG